MTRNIILGFDAKGNASLLACSPDALKEFAGYKQTGTLPKGIVSAEFFPHLTPQMVAQPFTKPVPQVINQQTKGTK